MKALSLGRTLYKGSKRETFRADGKTMRFRGPESAVLSALDLYEHHRAKMGRLLEVAENGYRFAAMPIPPSDDRKSNAAPLPEHLLHALRAAQSVGRTHSLTNTLTPKAGS